MALSHRVRERILVLCAVLLAAAAAAWQLLPTSDPGGRPLTVGTADPVSSLDPAGGHDAGSRALHGNLYQSLLTLSPGGVAPVPDAAESCAFNGLNLRTYVCELRDDLTFAGGRKVSAEDVVHSFRRQLRIAAKSGPHSGPYPGSPSSVFGTLESVAAQGRTVTFRLNARDATFPLQLACGAGAIVDRDRYPEDELREGGRVDGSGPYVLAEYEPGVRAVLEPNPSYRGAFATASRTSVEVRWFGAPEELADAWRAGRVDVAHRRLPAELLLDPDPDAVHAGAQVHESHGAEIRTLVFNVRPGAPLENRAVRQAIASVVDRARLTASGAGPGFAVRPLYSLIPQGVLGHGTPFFDRYPEPDATRAEQLLNDAGVATPVDFTLVHAEGGGPAREAAELRRQLEATELFRVRVVDEERQRFRRSHAKGGYDAYAVGWLPGFPDPDGFSRPLVGPAPAVGSGYASAAVREALAATRQHADRGRAVEDFKALQRVVAGDVPLLPLWQAEDHVLSSGDVAGAEHLSDGTGIWRLWSLARL
ncbi:ABC transporter substrate-binding protein [Streptomyces sp. HNM0663]|uniref:ABC transporter substrate-binding protein n=1 Tax=Streptomyces chengmaiensis TaxID=3040919 RepID=A0ABT6HUV0_9ACTN|nr:ABC transporter substrate-binding protein [Streptomyces chengmaiensis]MDH2391824.1 ABC transporter substrate-binding protein [Streptomyces chengmaiensis]